MVSQVIGLDVMWLDGGGFALNLIAFCTGAILPSP